MPLAPLVALLLSTTPTACDTVVVCPDEFRQALQPWLEHRTRQGRTFALVSNLQSPQGIRAGIRQAASGGKLRYVILVGDTESLQANSPEVRRRRIPVQLTEAKVTTRWGSESHIAADNWYADLDDDAVPDVAIGRLTPDSAGELSRIVAKILSYEQSTDFGAWRRRINFVAALGGFGPIIDTAVETAAKKLITDGIPPAFSTSMTYANWRSPYCPDPRRFHETSLARINEGCLFWVYMGHARSRAVDQVRVPGGAYPILDCNDTAQLNCQSGAAIACMLACYTGAFDARQDCLAEEMLRSAGGPVAILCGSRVTMPYAMAVMGTELLDACFVRRSETLGEAVLAAKRSMVLAERTSATQLFLDSLAKIANPTSADLAAERAEHVQLFNLLGDPLLRLRHPGEVRIRAPSTVRAGERLRLSGESGVEGSCTVELVARRDQLTFEPPRRSQYDASPASLVKFSEIYRRANDQRWIHAQTRAAGGRFDIQLDVPAEARGASHVRVFIEGSKNFAAGSTEIEILAAADADSKQAVSGTSSGAIRR